MKLPAILDYADGSRPADLVIENGRLVNVLTAEIYDADVAIAEDRIVAIGDVSAYVGVETRRLDAHGRHLVPGLLDGHLHLECSKLTVTMFGAAVLPFGTTTVVSALDQIYVVAGLDGVREMLAEADATPLKILWAAPFKAPYTLPESNVGFRFGLAEHRIAQTWPECIGIWETVSEFVLGRDEEVLDALELASHNRLPVFGCAPMARGAKVSALAAAGVRVDHESYTADEALEKLRSGIHLLVRESSVAKFLQENIQVVTRHGVNPGRVGFCTDDVTASDILKYGHLDRLVRMAINAGVDPMTAIQMATINCAQMYRVDHLVGSIAPGRYADVLLVDDLEEFAVECVVAKGRVVAENGTLTYTVEAPPRSAALLDTFKVAELHPGDLALRADLPDGPTPILAIEVDRDVPFIRRRRDVELMVVDGVVQPDVARDVLYVSVVERYGKTTNRPVAAISGFGLRSGALATTAAPDDNNIVCVGTSTADMTVAINHLILGGGGLVVVDHGLVVEYLQLPVGGIVADIEPEQMAETEQRLDAAAAELGCTLPSAFGYLMFLAITAIPDYAITDLGLIDCRELAVTDPVLNAPA